MCVEFLYFFRTGSKDCRETAEEQQMLPGTGENRPSLNVCQTIVVILLLPLSLETLNAVLLICRRFRLSWAKKEGLELLGVISLRCLLILDGHTQMYTSSSQPAEGFFPSFLFDSLCQELRNRGCIMLNFPFFMAL